MKSDKKIIYNLKNVKNKIETDIYSITHNNYDLTTKTIFNNYNQYYEELRDSIKIISKIEVLHGIKILLNSSVENYISLKQPIETKFHIDFVKEVKDNQFINNSNRLQISLNMSRNLSDFFTRFSTNFKWILENFIKDNFGIEVKIFAMVNNKTKLITFCRDDEYIDLALKVKFYIYPIEKSSEEKIIFLNMINWKIDNIIEYLKEQNEKK